MTNTHKAYKRATLLALWLCASLIGATAIMTQPASADDNGRDNNRQRQHVTPKKQSNRGGNHYGWRNNQYYQPRCTTRAERTWDMLWGEYRTHYVRQCWSTAPDKQQMNTGFGLRSASGSYSVSVSAEGGDNDRIRNPSENRDHPCSMALCQHRRSQSGHSATRQGRLLQS